MSEPPSEPAAPPPAAPGAPPPRALPGGRALLIASLAGAVALLAFLRLFPGPHSMFPPPDLFFTEWTVPGWLASLLGVRSAHSPAPGLSWLVVPALAGGLVALVLGRARLPAPARLALLLLLGWASLAAWPALDGPWARELQRPLHHPQHYWQDAGRLGRLDGRLAYPTPDGGRPYFSAYPELQGLDVLGMHARTHPPLAVATLYALRHLGLGPFAASLLFPLAGALLAGALYLYLAGWLGREAALTGAVTLLLVPQLGIYAATTLDVLFALAAGGASLAYLAWLRGGRPRALLGFALGWGLAAGLSFSALTLGAFLVLVSGCAWLGGRREALPRALIAAVVGLLAIGAVALVFGYDPLAVLEAAWRAQRPLEARWGRVQHPLYWRLAGAVAYQAALGLPLAALAWFLLAARGWDRARLDPFGGQGVLVAAALALGGVLLSGLVLGEAERILLPFTPLVLAGLAPALEQLRRERPRQLGLLLAGLIAQTYLVEVCCDTLG